MIGDAGVGMRMRPWAVLCLGLFVCIGAPAVRAADCPGHPDALGTSRTLVVDPKEHPRIGTMQYAETLPLEDHEVVLTFDDGPLPRNSNQILDILASECIKATFFTIGQMAHAYPEGVRKLRDAGHTIGTHSFSHPLTMDRMPIERARQEIDGGIAAVKAALGDDTALAPFFRIPGLMRAEGVEDYLASQGIQVWSADFPADDWRHISSSRVYDLAIRRIEAKGKGILLLHDIQARTVAALPRILRELKAQGFRIVHVVPATPDLPATPTQPEQWRLHPSSENVASAQWPGVRNFVFAQADMLPAPSLSDMDWRDGPLAASARPSDPASQRQGDVLPSQQASWPQSSALSPANAAIALPAPALSLFEIRETPSSRHAERTVATELEKSSHAKRASPEARGSRHAIRGRLRLARARRPGASRIAGRGAGNVAGAHRGLVRHLVQVKKRNV